MKGLRFQGCRALPMDLAHRQKLLLEMQVPRRSHRSHGLQHALCGRRVRHLARHTHFYAVDAANGKLLWSAPLPAKGPASSPLLADGVLVINAGELAAFDAATGKPLWTQPHAAAGNSSPVAWKFPRPHRRRLQRP